MTAHDAASERSVLSFAPGTLLADRFVLQRRLAVGGSGQVWLAINKFTRGPVAIKLAMRSDLTELSATRFRQEAALSAALAHRCIVRVYDFFEEPNGVLGLVMECLRGETARERLDRTGPLPPRTAVAIATQVLAGLAHAHELGIVHRDIKPPNVFLATDPDGNTIAKVLDFGIARTPTNHLLTLNGQLLGTPRYMSPEQIRADPTIDGRSDLFSVAVLVYELITGKAPFAAPFPTASLARVLESPVAQDERIPAPLWAVLEKALDKDRAGRHATATALADELRLSVASSDVLLAQELHRSRPPPPILDGTIAPIVAPLTTPPPAAPKRNLPGWSAALVAITACATVLAVVATRAPQHQPGAAPAGAAAAAPAPALTAPSEPAPAPSPAAAPRPEGHRDATVATDPNLPTPFSLVPPPRPPAAHAASGRPAAAPRKSPPKGTGIVTDPGF
jgi:serine/threonine-protein kinase